MLTLMERIKKVLKARLYNTSTKHTTDIFKEKKQVHPQSVDR